MREIFAILGLESTISNGKITSQVERRRRFLGDFEVVFPVLALIDPSDTLGIGPFEHIKSIFFACGGPDLKFLLSLSELLPRSQNVSRNRGGGSIT